MRQSRIVNKVQKSRSLVGAGPRGGTFARAVPRKGATFEDLELFFKVLQTRYGNIPVCCDQEECLREVVHSTAGRLGLPTGVTAVEQSQANGRAERERLQVMLEDARSRGAEIILDHLVAQWTVRHAEGIQNFFVESDVDLSGGGTIKITPHEHTHWRQCTEQCCWIVGASSCSQKNQR